MVRPGELRLAEWTEFDEKNRIWLIPAEKMKMRDDHEVPLSGQQERAMRTMNYGFNSVGLN
jgi:integrase